MSSYAILILLFTFSFSSPTPIQKRYFTVKYDFGSDESGTESPESTELQKGEEEEGPAPVQAESVGAAHGKGGKHGKGSASSAAAAATAAADGSAAVSVSSAVGRGKKGRKKNKKKEKGKKGQGTGAKNKGGRKKDGKKGKKKGSSAAAASAAAASGGHGKGSSAAAAAAAAAAGSGSQEDPESNSAGSNEGADGKKGKKGKGGKGSAASAAAAAAADDDDGDEGESNEEEDGDGGKSGDEGEGGKSGSGEEEGDEQKPSCMPDGAYSTAAAAAAAAAAAIAAEGGIASATASAAISSQVSFSPFKEQSCPCAPSARYGKMDGFRYGETAGDRDRSGKTSNGNYDDLELQQYIISMMSATGLRLRPANCDGKGEKERYLTALSSPVRYNLAEPCELWVFEPFFMNGKRVYQIRNVQRGLYLRASSHIYKKYYHICTLRPHDTQDMSMYWDLTGWSVRNLLFDEYLTHSPRNVTGYVMTHPITSDHMVTWVLTKKSDLSKIMRASFGRNKRRRN